MLKVKGIVLFGSGLLVGGVTGFLLGRKYQEQEMIEHIVKDDIPEELKRKSYDQDFEDYPASEEEEKEALREARKRMKEELKVNYRSYYEQKKAEEEYLAEGEAPEETAGSELDERVEEILDEMLDESEEMVKDHQLHRNDPPEFVDEESVGDLPAYVQEYPMYYDVEEDTLFDEDDNVVEDRELLIAGLLENHFTLVSEGKREDKGMIYIWNHAHDALYSIEFI